MLTALAIAALCQQVGFSGAGLVNATAVALAESGGDPGALSPTGDRGLFQLSARWHPEVDDQCAYDATCNARAAYRISRGGADWSPWSTWHNGAAARRMDEARAAVAQLPQTRQQVGASTAGSALSSGSQPDRGRAGDLPSPQLLAGGLGLLALLWLLG